MNKRSIIIISVLLLFTLISAVTGIQNYLDTTSPDPCGDGVCVTIKTDQDTYSLTDDLYVDVWLSNNGNSIYRDVLTVFDILIANSSQTVMRHLKIHVSITGDFQLYPHTKTKIFTFPLIDLSVHIAETGEYPFHSGQFTIVVQCRHADSVLAGNTTFIVM
jgi:hypothetical protein